MTKFNGLVKRNDGWYENVTSMPVVFKHRNWVIPQGHHLTDIICPPFQFIRLRANMFPDYVGVPILEIEREIPGLEARS